MRRICNTCGTWYAEGHTPNDCFICQEERQYVPEGGQKWVTPDALSSTHKNKILQLNSRLFEIVIDPSFAIGQRAFLVLSDNGNMLWDCVPLLDQGTIDFIQSKGGIDAIGFSHPHYYSNMNDWAQTFDCPIYIHHTDEPFIVDKGGNIRLWQGDEKPLWNDLKIVNIGGHFTGSSVLMISGMGEKGTLLCGDTFYISPSKKHFAMMYSYPNRMPLPIAEIKRIKERFDTVSFDAVYGFYSYQNVLNNAKAILDSSIARYIR